METNQNFAPITITIRTEAEANRLWMLLNLPSKAIIDFSPQPEYDHPLLALDMFNSFSKVYNPKI